ncbi:uncharacterized protein LOC144053970 isoform X1 [Vanacampus margaritifer]
MEDIVAPTFGVGHSTNWNDRMQRVKTTKLSQTAVCADNYQIYLLTVIRQNHFMGSDDRDILSPPDGMDMYGLWYLRHKKLKHCPHTPHRERPFSDLPSTGNDITVAQGSANNQSWLTCFLSLVMCRLQADFGTY